MTTNNLLKQALMSTLYCNWEYHFANLKSKYAALIYSQGLRLQHNTQVYNVSVPTAAAYFGIHETTARNALHEIRDNGWAKELSALQGKEVQYRMVDHDEWAAARDAWNEKHPNALSRHGPCCIRKEYARIDDQLGKTLWAITRQHFYKNMLEDYRALASDEQVAACARKLWEKECEQKTPSKGFQGRLRRCLKQQAAVEPALRGALAGV